MSPAWRRTRLAVLLVVALSGGAAARAETPAPRPPARPGDDAASRPSESKPAGADGTAPKPGAVAEPEGRADKPPGRPVQGYVSRGIRSRFGFGVGVHVGVNNLSAKRPLLSGISAHFRMSGVAGLTLEYDFNRVASTPAPDDLSVRSLHFIPNLRVAAVLVPYRWRMLGPFVMLGLGIDTEARTDRANLLLGMGLEATFWKDRIGVVAEFRAFLPRPSDVEKLKERREISGTAGRLRTAEYYGQENLLFTLSVRAYY